VTVKNKIINGFKICPKCLENLPLSDYHFSPKKMSSYCKPCHTSITKAYWQRTKEIQKSQERVRKYGIDTEGVEKMFNAQCRKCAICLCTDPGKTGWKVDHNHEFNFVRGVLCHRCNAFIGLAKEKEEILARAIAYLDAQFRT
jgi:hypothetical protein